MGVLWDKATDQIAVTFPYLNVEPTKRGILQQLAPCYDPVELAAPILLVGKTIYRNYCELGVSWDQPLPESYQKKLINWESSLPPTITVPRAFQLHQEQIEAIDLHMFGDASVSANAVIYQSSQVSQGLVTAKARLSKKDLTIPRLGLVTMHMATNLCQNLKSALEGEPIRNIYGWTSSSVALRWVRGKGNYKKFVRNRVKEIQKKSYIQWRYIPTEENPAEVASRECSPQNIPTV